MLIASQLGIGKASSQPKLLQQTSMAAVAQVQLWDCSQMRQIRCLSGHSAQVSSMAWNGSVLSTGSRDTSILDHDVRCVGADPIVRYRFCPSHSPTDQRLVWSTLQFFLGRRVFITRAAGSRPTCKAAWLLTQWRFAVSSGLPPAASWPVGATTTCFTCGRKEQQSPHTVLHSTVRLSRCDSAPRYKSQTSVQMPSATKNSTLFLYAFWCLR